MTLGTNLRSLADFKNNMIVSGPDFAKVQPRRTNGTDMFIGMMVSEHAETAPDIDPCAEDEMPLGMVLGYTNQDEADATYGYWYQDGDVPFANNKWVYVGIPVSGQVLWFCSVANTTIAIGDPLHIEDGLMSVSDTGDDIYAISVEAVTGASSTTKYFRARVR